MVKGGDWDVSGHCKLAGLLLHCRAKNIRTDEMETSSPWHNFVSDTVHCRNEAANSKLCSNNLTEEHTANPTVQTLLGAGAMKIWDGNFQNLTLIGTPFLAPNFVGGFFLINYSSGSNHIYREVKVATNQLLERMD